MHEAQLHPYNSFLTLTYSDENLPENNSLSKRDHQLFMKRLRKTHSVRFYSAGEYGTQTQRPHYHVCLFGYHFPDRLMNGQNSYSAELEAIWGKGNCDVRNLTFELAAYAARYICDKVTGDRAKQHYERENEYGDKIQLQPEFNLMSRGRGIGRGFFDDFKTSMYPHDRVIVNGKPAKPPRYYDKLYEKIEPDNMELIKTQRELDATLRYLDNTPARLAVREKVTYDTLVKKRKV